MLITLSIDNGKQTFSTANSEILLGATSQRLIGLQNIQSALDIAQLQAWQDLVRELDDVKNAVDTVARRSNGLMSFVTSYRQLSHLPPPQKTLILIAALFKDVCRIATASWPEQLAAP